MGLMNFLGKILLINESVNKFGNVPTFLGCKLLDEELEDEELNEEIDNVWHEIQNNDKLTEDEEIDVNDLYQQLLDTDSKREAIRLINEIRNILNKKEKRRKR